MPEMTHSVIDASKRAAQRLAGRETPFVHNCWYVAGFAWEFSRTLLARTLLERPLVLFRTEVGAPVALADRCVHRSFPLSKSRLVGDTVVCGYHGLGYDAAGACVEGTALGGPPPAVGVRSYPLREQGPLVWIWMGDQPPAAELPIGDWAASPDWPASQQYYHLPASYIALHENLLDLTHLTVLHAASFGTPDYASAPFEVALDEASGRFAVRRSVVPTRLPPVWGEPLGLMGKDAARVIESEFVAPSAHVVHGHFYDLDQASAPPDTRIRTAHLPTPETSTTTHYFIHHGRNFAVDDPSVTQFMQEHLTVAFTEDVVGLAEVERAWAATPQADRYEISLPFDRAGVAMRRWLMKAAQGER